MQKRSPKPKVDIDDITSEVTRLRINDAKKSQHSKEVYNHLEIEIGEQQIEHLKQVIKDKELDRKLREQYSSRVIWYLWFYSGFVAIVIVVNGFCDSCWSVDFRVLMVLAGSTSVAAIGLVGFVIQGLFNSK